MTIREWLEVLHGLPSDLVLPQLVKASCTGCHRVTVATGFDSEGDPMVPGWKRCVDDSSLWACGCECAEAVGSEMARRGRKRPRWKWSSGGE